MRSIVVEEGSIVRSVAGRDAGRLFLVTEILDDEYVLLADGKLRKAGKPKKKKLRHIRTTGKCIREASEVIREGGCSVDARIRSWLSNEEEM